SHAMAAVAMCSIAVSDPDVAARNGLEHEGEILGTHGWLHRGDHIVVANDTLKYAGAELGLCWIVDGRRIAPHECKVGAAVHGPACMFSDFAHAGLDQIQCLVRKRAYCATQHSIVRDDII